eukprot:CAMPEP_0183323638 /NCGR_PEP_ID=MMETSP0160_2-20130417/74977_1 /TAXON_ID=2839 ORGANISM="Odontella Sinensis, Strain Grunow 1884" /NCGR_SAMPLE_ID=MMETSP0160_2 /ASSEMBLY_ACC=CAM_ASM_000250 /LENGTH=175 /DNA_ID=CAMNT_0025491059 /DNA_START=280 /DNA_END=804 /DNA_ORIENTATION=+
MTRLTRSIAKHPDRLTVPFRRYLVASECLVSRRFRTSGVSVPVRLVVDGRLEVTSSLTIGNGGGGDHHHAEGTEEVGKKANPTTARVSSMPRGQRRHSPTATKAGKKSSVPSSSTMPSFASKTSLRYRNQREGMEFASRASGKSLAEIVRAAKGDNVQKRQRRKANSKAKNRSSA